MEFVFGKALSHEEPVGTETETPTGLLLVVVIVVEPVAKPPTKLVLKATGFTDAPRIVLPPPPPLALLPFTVMVCEPAVLVAVMVDPVQVLPRVLHAPVSVTVTVAGVLPEIGLTLNHVALPFVRLKGIAATLSLLVIWNVTCD